MPPTDSTAAMRAAAHADTAAPIRHSPGHDTLSLPARAKGSSQPGVSLPLYYREGFFTGDTLLHPELDGGRYGVAGDPVPETMRADDTVTIALLACFAITITATSRSLKFIARQAKELLRPTGEGRADDTETSAEVRFQFFFVLQACLLLATVSFIYTLECVADTFILSSQYQLVGIFFGIFAAYFLVKLIASWAVNNVFFGRKKSVRWLKSQLFATSVEGIALFPVVLLQAYFDLSIQKAVIYVIFVIVVSKIMLLYKSFVMFFRHKNFFLQIILYFCALEIMPLLSLGGILVKVVDYLKINF